MKFSYKVNNNYLIDSVCLPLNAGEVYLLAGIENMSFSLLGGIIAKLFPVNEKLEWPQLQALIEHYNGELDIEEGSLPSSSFYVGVDPDRHLLFSTVTEEIIVQVGSSKNLAAVLMILGLDYSFLERNISTLSGGEKMKVALSIAFSSEANCYVLHGVIPWLDKRGRELLANQIDSIKKRGSCVVFLEHEVYALRNIVDRVFEFDGITTSEINKSLFFKNALTFPGLEKSAQVLSDNLLGEGSSKPIIYFKNVSLWNHPYSDFVRVKPLLDRVSFHLLDRHVYFLIGNNGAGKSTIAQLIFKLLKPSGGEIVFCGKLLENYTRKELADSICYVGQFPEQQITLSTIGQYKLRAQERENLLSLKLMNNYLSLDDDFPISLLSHLQMKLLIISSFITNRTKLIILDEPTWGLDKYGQQKILEVLGAICKSLHLTLLFISHDLRLVKKLNAKILLIRNSNLIYFENVDDFILNKTTSSDFDLSAMSI